jgi:hypothetical protein
LWSWAWCWVKEANSKSYRLKPFYTKKVSLDKNFFPRCGSGFGCGAGHGAGSKKATQKVIGLSLFIPKKVSLDKNCFPRCGSGFGCGAGHGAGSSRPTQKVIGLSLFIPKKVSLDTNFCSELLLGSAHKWLVGTKKPSFKAELQPFVIIIINLCHSIGIINRSWLGVRFRFKASVCGFAKPAKNNSEPI